MCHWSVKKPVRDRWQRLVHSQNGETPLFPSTADRPTMRQNRQTPLMSVCCLSGESERVSVRQTGRVAYSTSASERSHSCLVPGRPLFFFFPFPISILIQWLVLVSVSKLSSLETVLVYLRFWKCGVTVAGCWCSATVGPLHIGCPSLRSVFFLSSAHHLCDVQIYEKRCVIFH